MKLSHIIFPGLLISAIACSKKSDNDNGQTTPPVVTPTVKTDVAMWLTNPDKTQLLAKQNTSLLFSSTTNQYSTINVDTTTTYQSIDGFGFSLTGRSATLINNLPAAQSQALVNELFLRTVQPSASAICG